MSRPNDQPLVIELLIPSDSRRERITIEAHSQFRQSITEAPVVFDEIDMAVADAEKHLDQRSRHGKNSVLRILDELERGGR